MPRIEIVLAGHLLVAGGQAADLGVDLATARCLGSDGWTPYIPATAVRGAVRLQLEALLRAKNGSAVDPYPEAPPVDDVVAHLFGYSGPPRRRDGSREGALRFGDALPTDPQAARLALAVRPGLEIDDQTSSASAGKLYFLEVAELGEQPLVFFAPVAVDGATDDDLRLLEAAVAVTDAVGAGKSKGGGAVTMTWHREGGELARSRIAGDATTARRARLVLELLEPAHFGDGGPRGNHHATRGFVPGATVRGAVAWALLRGGRLDEGSPEFRALFLDEAAPVSFGDALLCPEGTDEAAVAPATRRRRRGPRGLLDDILVRELARERVNPHLTGRGLYLRVDDGADRFDPLPAARPDTGLVRRTRTRVSIDRWQGVAASGRLFSIEQLEPWLEAAGSGAAPAGGPGAEAESAPIAPLRRTRFVSVIEGPPGALRHLALLAGLPLLLGGGRNHGLGQVQAELLFEAEPAKEHAIERLRALGRLVESEAARLARGAGEAAAAGGAREDAHPVALVALSDWVPTGAGIDHPLAEPALGAAGLASEAPLRAFLRPDGSGGYDQTPGRLPLKALLPAVGAGSIFVYELDPDRLATLAGLLPALRRGVGQRVASGCGRFGPFHPHTEEQP